MKLNLTLLAALVPLAALAGDTVHLLPAKDKELQLPYGETKTIEFVCPWDATKKPTVLEFHGRIDTPSKDASTGGPADLLKIEINGQPLAAETQDGKPRLLNKPMKSPRDPSIRSEVVWFTEPHWALMYCGSWTPPDNVYSPREGSSVRFVLDVSDLVRANATNELVFGYAKSMVGEQTLAEHCREMNLGDATVVLGDLQIRPRNESDVFRPSPKQN